MNASKRAPSSPSSLCDTARPTLLPRRHRVFRFGSEGNHRLPHGLENRSVSELLTFLAGHKFNALRLMFNWEVSGRVGEVDGVA